MKTIVKKMLFVFLFLGINFAFGQKEREYIENSDLNKIKKEVKEAFEEWAERGEFEKTEEYNARMRYKEKILEGLIEEKVYDKMKEYYSIDFIKYNPDAEIYDIAVYSIINSSYSYTEYTKKLKGQIKIEPSLAKRLYENDLERSFYKSFEYRLFKDGYIYPNHIIIEDKVYMITFPEGDITLSNYKMSDFNFSTNDLGLSQYFIDNKMVKLSDIKVVRDSYGDMLINYEAQDIEKINGVRSGEMKVYGLEKNVEERLKNYTLRTNGQCQAVEGAFSFDIDEDGKTLDIKVYIRSNMGMKKEMEEDIKKVVKQSKWIPAVKDGVAVKDSKAYGFKYDGCMRADVGKYRKEDVDKVKVFIENKGKTQESKKEEKKKGGGFGRFLGNVLETVLTN